MWPMEDGYHAAGRQGLSDEELREGIDSSRIQPPDHTNTLQNEARWAVTPGPTHGC
jgi:hypothetical protein